MEEKNELNDIILNKSGGASGNKKIVLAVATLGIILIIVVLLMNTLTSGGTNNLPKAVLPPEPNVKTTSQMDEDPLFEEVEVLEEEMQENDSLDKIAQRLKQESLTKQAEKPSPAVEKKPEVIEVVEKKPEVKKEVVAKKVEKPKAKPAKKVYIQVGSFTKYEPNKKFLKSITSKGFKYKYHKIIRNSKTLNKVLVGPFKSEKDARDALRTIRSSVEAGAFLVKI